MGQGFHVIPASANPPGGPGIAMQYVDDNDTGLGLAGVQLCDQCYFDDCEDLPPADICGANLCGASVSRPATLTVTVAVEHGGCSGSVCGEPDTPPGPCGDELMCGSVPKCSACTCANGTYVLTRTGTFPGNKFSDCTYQFSKTAAQGYRNCCRSGDNHTLRVTVEFRGINGSETMYVTVAGVGSPSAKFSTTQQVPDCGNFTINIHSSFGCVGTVTVTG